MIPKVKHVADGDGILTLEHEESHQYQDLGTEVSGKPSLLLLVVLQPSAENVKDVGKLRGVFQIGSLEKSLNEHVQVVRNLHQGLSSVLEEVFVLVDVFLLQLFLELLQKFVIAGNVDPVHFVYHEGFIDELDPFHYEEVEDGASGEELLLPADLQGFVQNVHIGAVLAIVLLELVEEFGLPVEQHHFHLLLNSLLLLIEHLEEVFPELLDGEEGVHHEKDHELLLVFEESLLIDIDEHLVKQLVNQFLKM